MDGAARVESLCRSVQQSVGQITTSGFRFLFPVASDFEQSARG
jgi:hypothetical protein